ncbi:unnamed protein product [Chrysodeixis includens]|uniref:Uncharacterized protein n=1 Tax=Chrysodeixis includens TaxID=689277 RepID=A0A9N8KVR5_CHRIL|nr:unnamed protein product [Chrysodeixis includens]
MRERSCHKNQLGGYHPASLFKCLYLFIVSCHVFVTSLNVVQTVNIIIFLPLSHFTWGRRNMFFYKHVANGFGYGFIVGRLPDTNPLWDCDCWWFTRHHSGDPRCLVQCTRS